MELRDKINQAIKSGLYPSLERTLPPAIRAQLFPDEPAFIDDIPKGFTLPAAMNHLAKRFGLALRASDDELTKEYGAKPGKESIKMLATEIGADITIRKINIDTAPANHFPLIAITKQGTALILHDRDDKFITVEGTNGVAKAPTAQATTHLTGAVILFTPGEAAISRLANAPEITTTSQAVADLSPAKNLPLWLAINAWRNDRPELARLLSVSLISNLFLIALPLFIMSVYDRVIPHAAFESLITLTIGILIILGADLGLRFVRLKFIDAIGLKISRDLQLNLYRRLVSMPLAKRPKSASVISNVQPEIETACLLTPEFFVGVISDSIFALFVLALIAYIGGVIVLAPMIGICAVGCAIYAGSKLARKNAQKLALLKSAGHSQVNETFESLTAIKATGAEHPLLSKFERLSDASASIGHHSRLHQRYSGQAVSVIVQMTIVCTLCFGVLRISSGVMSIGSLAAVTILVGRAIMPVSQLIDQYCRLKTLKEVLATAFDLVSDEEEKAGDDASTSARRFKGTINLHNVSLRHASAELDALQNLSLEIKPGEKIGLIGKNGCGKSTLLHLFPRLLIPTNGTILIDGYDARQYSPRRLRQEIGFMPQETVLFNETLRENICLGPNDFTEEDFERATYLAGVDRFARRHPHGYSMQVGPRGEFLSAGERQAVGLARVLLRPRKMLVLDEPSSLMDHTAEGQLIKSLSDHLKNTTLIVSTHRMRILELVSRVITLESGQIIADGPKDQVLKSLSPQKAPTQQSFQASA